MATVELRMTEEQFYTSTLKKLYALMDVHREVKGAGTEDEEAFIDSIL